MFYLIQSNDIERLAVHLMSYYRQTQAVFSSFVVITPAKVLEEWLKKTIASQVGISTLFTTQFWGQYQWQMIGQVLQVDAKWQAERGQVGLSVPEVAVLSQSVIRWRLFDYLMAVNADGKSVARQALDDDNHPAHFLMVSIAQNDDQSHHSGNNEIITRKRLWRLCDSVARLYVKYLTQRADWLMLWATGKSVDVLAMIAKKDDMAAHFATMVNESTAPDNHISTVDFDTQTPEWLAVHYQAVETALQFFWQQLFAPVFLYRVALERRFWQVLEGDNVDLRQRALAVLPKTLYLFTVQQLPQIELDFLKRLSRQLDIVLLHFNPSQMFWADIVDKNWYHKQQIIRPSSVYLKDYGHGLLSRLGKESRETFAMLAHLSGGDDERGFKMVWQDDFVNPNQNLPKAKKTLLGQLKEDILMLDEGGVAEGLQWSWDNLKDKRHQSNVDWVLDWQDDSLAIHSCHSLKRQLEVLRVLIGQWLNRPNADGSQRKLSDVAVMLPDIQSNRQLIASIFGTEVGVDGLVLPAYLTGVANGVVLELWQAMTNFYRLTAGRFYAEAVYEWLMLPALYQNFGLTETQMYRGCQLLRLAGFVRGLDGEHLKETLEKTDKDYRRTFAYAIDSLMSGFLFGAGLSTWAYPFVWHSALPEKNLGVAVNTDDEIIIGALCRIYMALKRYQGKLNQEKPILTWLDELETDLIDGYFFAQRQSESMRQIFDAKNSMKASILANYYHQKQSGQPSHHETPLCLTLDFVLDSLETVIGSQQVSAEPSGVITFGRFGALRGIPFGLVVMLDMNLSSFPRSEPNNRLDLMKAGLPRRGDRNHEDDDNGAFLEAILAAKETCWIFYTGQTQESKPLLPAAPVNELILFLKHLPWSNQAGLAVKDITDDLTDWLVTKHAATPFERSAFEWSSTPNAFDIIKQQRATKNPPAPLWQAVYQALLAPRHASFLLDLPNQACLQLLAHSAKQQWQIDTTPCPTASVLHLLTSLGVAVDEQSLLTIFDVAQLANLLKNPAKTYLKNKKFIFVKTEQTPINEPLTLDFLQAFGVSNSLLHDDKVLEQSELAPMYWDNLTRLPAGMARLSSLKQQQAQLQALVLFFDTIKASYHLPSQNQAVTPTQSEKIVVFGTVLSVVLPVFKDKGTVEIWYHIRPSKVGAYHLLSAYLHHVAWQVARNRLAVGVFGDEGSSVWQYRLQDKTPSTYGFAPMTAQKAQKVLRHWLIVAQVMYHLPLVITPKTALDYLTWQESGDDLSRLVAQSGDWLSDKKTTDENANNPYWQTLLGKNDPWTTLLTVLSSLAQPWYGELAEALIVLTDPPKTPAQDTTDKIS